MNNEIWMPIPEYIMPDIDPTGYYVSSHGRIFSTRLNTSSCLLKPRHISNKAESYTSVALPARDGGKYKKDKTIHRIVLISFNPIVGMNELDVNHIDGNAFNNRVKDLSLNLSFYILKNNVWRWITYLGYGLNN